MNYRELAEKSENYIIEKRRWFHRHPELSWQEFKTTDEIVKELLSLGYEVKRFDGKPGCTGFLKGGKAKAGCKTVALRADIDALPVLEKTGAEYASENENVMHACGHDCHIAMLLGAAKMLAETKEELCGNVKLLFQPSEEDCTGAPYCIEQGVLDGVDAMFGQHIWGTLDAPYMNVQPGRRMACCDNFTIKVSGVSAHCTQPHLGTDALLAACAIMLNLQPLQSRGNDPLNPFVLAVGEMHAGQRFNIIANHAELYGTVRTYSESFRSTVHESILRVVENTARAYGAAAEVEYKRVADAVVNDDDELNSIAAAAAVKLYGDEALKPFEMLMGSEDYSFYMQKVPAVFGFVGSRNAEKCITAVNHNDHYDVDESVLKRGAALSAQFAFDFLEQHS